MDIWLIQNGEKTGPFQDFEVRRRIHNGELAESTPAWHEGMPTWTPLGHISLFEREFKEGSSPEESAGPIPEPDGAPQPPPIPTDPHLIRRFWARWFDLYVYSGLWWLAIWAAGRDVETTLLSPWVMLVHYVPWFAIEAVLIQRFGTTPGKWLLGIHVVNDNGTPLDLSESIRRSSRVLFVGIGFGISILTLICQVMSLFTTRRIGRPLWDHAGRHHLETSPIRAGRILAYVVSLAAALMVQFLVLLPYMIEQMSKDNPQFREQYEKLREELRQQSKE